MPLKDLQIEPSAAHNQLKVNGQGLKLPFAVNACMYLLQHTLHFQINYIGYRTLVVTNEYKRPQVQSESRAERVIVESRERCRIF